MHEGKGGNIGYVEECVYGVINSLVLGVTYRGLVAIYKGRGQVRVLKKEGPILRYLCFFDIYACIVYLIINYFIG